MKLGNYTIPDARDIKYNYKPVIIDKISSTGILHREFVTDEDGNKLIEKSYELTIYDLSASDVTYLTSIDGTDTVFEVFPGEFYTVNISIDFFKFDNLIDYDAANIVINVLPNIEDEDVVTDYISFYKFDGNTDDETGNYDATNNGSTLTTGLNGDANTAYLFDGTNDYMQTMIGNLDSEKSYSFWVYLINPVFWGMFIYYTDSSLGSPSVSDSIGLYEDKLSIYTFDGAIKSIVGGTVLLPNTWYHIVYTRKNGGYMKAYINGIYEIQLAVGTCWTGGDRHLFGHIGNSATWLNGKLDNVRIYDKELTTDEINQIYNYEKPD